jgi:hypothetical protein
MSASAPSPTVGNKHQLESTSETKDHTKRSRIIDDKDEAFRSLKPSECKELFLKIVMTLLPIWIKNTGMEIITSCLDEVVRVIRTQAEPNYDINEAWTSGLSIPELFSTELIPGWFPAGAYSYRVTSWDNVQPELHKSVTDDLKRIGLTAEIDLVKNQVQGLKEIAIDVAQCKLESLLIPMMSQRGLSKLENFAATAIMAMHAIQSSIETSGTTPQLLLFSGVKREGADSLVLIFNYEVVPCEHQLESECPGVSETHEDCSTENGIGMDLQALLQVDADGYPFIADFAKSGKQFKPRPTSRPIAAISKYFKGVIDELHRSIKQLAQLHIIMTDS